ncbi:MAG: hypothetical protein LQ337_002157 [Flavoplaca oasis]|nr:MAG: hypothetical protein LQ337_002157 [Flavoplaca oasis]
MGGSLFLDWSSASVYFTLVSGNRLRYRFSPNDLKNLIDHFEIMLVPVRTLLNAFVSMEDNEGQNFLTGGETISG